MVCIDAEWGLGMRLDSVMPLNHQMMLGAISDSASIYHIWKISGSTVQAKGIQVNFAPVVDINNNPNNPVINDRSFGEINLKWQLWSCLYERQCRLKVFSPAPNISPAMVMFRLILIWIFR